MERIFFQKGKFYSLPIVDKIKEGNKSFFIVSANGNSYPIKMFDFQKDDPETNSLTHLPVMVKECYADHIVFVQNFAIMFDHLFEDGESYPFSVVRHVMSGPDGQSYYDVRDFRGLPFRLKTAPSVILRPQQKIYCRVSKPTRNKLTLEYEANSFQIDAECLTPQEVIDESEVDPIVGRFFRKIFHSSDYFAEAREYLEQNDPEWIVKAVLAFPSVDKWSNLNSGDNFDNGGRADSNRICCIEEFIKLALHILEDSQFLWQFSESEREYFQEEIAARLEECQTWLNCLRLIAQKTESEEVKSILTKIEKSGYIFRPKEKMALLIAIFSLKPTLLETNIDNILEIVDKSIKGRNLDSFKRAFVEFMRFYISTNRVTVDRVAFADDPHSRLLVDRMVKAIYHTLLLSEEEEQRTPLYRSMLYHYLSFVREEKSQAGPSGVSEFSLNLIDRAFKALLGADSNKMEIVQGLETGQLELFAHLLTDRQRQDNTFASRSFESDEIRLTVNCDGITIAPAIASGKEKEVLKKLLPWQNIAIYLDNPSRLNIEPRSKLPKWKEWWSRIETELLRPQKKKPEIKIRKFYPDAGKEVTVRVLRQEKDMPNRFYCRIEDEEWRGEGWLDTYNKGGSTALFHYDPNFDIESFYYEGAPMMLRVKVNSRKPLDEDGFLFNFAAMQLIDQYVQEYVEYDEECDCRIISFDDKNRYYFGVTQHGYGVFIPELNEDLDFAYSESPDECLVRVRITDTSKPNQIQAEVIAHGSDFSVKDAAENLLFSYCNGDYYEETQEEREEDAMAASEDRFEPSEMSQLISLLDHLALLQDNNVVSYGYLSVAHIIAYMIGDRLLVDYLDERRRLLCVLDNFGNQGKVDDSELIRLGSANNDMVENFPVLKERLCELEIVGSLGKQEKNSYLWKLTESYHPSQKIGKLSRLMLAYNLADSFGMQEQQAEVITKIKSLLNVNIELPTIYSFGEEDQLTEFKSSIVYPPENGMRPDLARQTFNILRVINGMANAYGGNLYLGVYDTGTAKGLEDDLAFPEFANSHDKFDRYVRNSIRQTMGLLLNSAITIEYPEAGGKWIYLIKVRPMKDPIPMKWKDQIYYFMRQGSSTYAITERSKLAALMEERDMDYYSRSSDSSQAETVPMEGANISEANKTKNKSVIASDTIPTSLLRPNVTESWREDYGKDTVAYIRIHKVGEWSLLDEVEWEEGLLTLAISEREKDGHLIIVYDDGEVMKTSISKLLNKDFDQRHKMASGKRPIFVAPASKGAALLFIYTDTRDRRFIRLDDISEMQEVNIHEKGTKLIENEVASVRCCEIIPHELLENLKFFRGLKRSNPGVQYSAAYNSKDFKFLRNLGLDIER